MGRQWNVILKVNQMFNAENNNIASCAMWMWSMVSYIKGGTRAKGIWKQDPEANILTHSGEWRRLHNEELHSLYSSPNIIMVIRPRRLRWAGHVARMEESRSAFKMLTGIRTGKWLLGRTILEWTLRRLVSMLGIGLIRLRIGTIGEPLWMRHWTSRFLKLWS